MIPFYEKKIRNLYGNISTINFFPHHLHTHLEIIYMMNGSSDITIKSNEYHLEKGDLAVVFPNTIHSFVKSSHRESAMVLICGQELIGDHFNQIIKYSPKVPIIKADMIHDDVLYAVNSLFKEAKLDVGVNLSSKKALTELILSRILPCLQLEKNNGAFDGDMTSKIIAYICDNFKKQLSLEVLSHDLGVNKFYISRIFTNKIGVSFNDYINNLRVDLSKKLLQNTDLPILEISNECGFETQRTFNRIFKKIVDMTPMEYRSQKI